MNKEIVKFIKDLFESIRIPIFLVKVPCEDWRWWDQGLRSEILKIENIASRCNNWIKQLEDKKIYHLTDEFKCTYTVFKETEEYFVFTGPVLFEKIEESNIISVMKQLHVSSEQKEELKTYYSKIPVFASQAAYEKIFHLAGKYLWGEHGYEIMYLNAEEMKSWDEIYKTYLDVFRKEAELENDMSKPRMIESLYQIEDSIVMAVSNGNEVLGMKSLEQWQVLKYPNTYLLTLEQLREDAFVFNTLFRQAVYQSGVQPIHAEIYAQRNAEMIKQMQSIEKGIEFQRKLVSGFCKLVKNMRQKSYSQVTQKVINYIDTDICADLQLKNIAARFNITPNYLSSLFHKEVGISLIDYVNSSRIQHSKRFLLSTGDSIKKIALACGFSDSYYYCRLFKRECGMTPTQYRKTVGYDEFIKLQSRHILENEKAERTNEL